MRSGGLRGLQIPRSGVSVRGGFDSHAFPPLVAVVTIALLALLPWGVATADDRSAGDRAVTPGGGPVAAVPESSTVAGERAAPADTVSRSGAESPPGAERPAPEPVRARRVLPPPGRFDQPRWVMLRSLVLPGWGQAHNGAWIKAAAVAIGDGALRVRFFRDERRLRDLDGTATLNLGALETAEQVLAAAQDELAAAQAAGDSARIAAAQAALVSANLNRAGASDAYNQAVIAYNTLLDKSINRRWLLGGVVLYALIDAYVDAHFKRFDINLEFDPALPGGTGVPGGRLQIRWAF